MRHDGELLGRWLFLAAFLLIAFFVFASAIGSEAHASSSPRVRLRLSAADRVLAARVAANEDSRPLRSLGNAGGTAGEPTTDTLAILQVVDGFARWRKVSHGTALRLLAPHVTGTRAPTRRRHAVIGALPASGRATPAGWERELDGDWQVHSKHWARFRKRVEQLIVDGFEPPCPRDVITWGNESDTPIALSRGLVLVDCGPTANGIWGQP